MELELIKFINKGFGNKKEASGPLPNDMVTAAILTHVELGQGRQDQTVVAEVFGKWLKAVSKFTILE